MTAHSRAQGRRRPTPMQMVPMADDRSQAVLTALRRSGGEMAVDDIAGAIRLDPTDWDTRASLLWHLDALDRRGLATSGLRDGRVIACATRPKAEE